MKRIYYGQHTLDVSNDFARVFEAWIEENVSGVYYSTSYKPVNGGPRPQFYAVPWGLLHE